MTDTKMILGTQLNSGYGSEPGAWRMPGAEPGAYSDMDFYVELAKTAERGKMQLIFFADTPALDADLATVPPRFAIDPMLTLTAIARETSRIGLVATGSTTFNEPYNLARQFKALDVLSHGRAGWNAVTTSNEAAAANFGQRIASREERYGRAHEFIQIVQALWGSWEEDAWTRDTVSGQFADVSKIQPINLGGRYVSSRGPLPIPPSEQGQPVIFQAGPSGEGLQLAGMYASGVYANPFTIDDARMQRKITRDAAVAAGRNPDDVKVLLGFMPSIAASRRAALDRRLQLDASTDVVQKVQYLSQIVGTALDTSRLDEPATPEQIARLRPNLQDPRSHHAAGLLREGWSLRDVVAHGVINYHPVVPGTGEDVADFLQEWFEAGGCDGFSIVPDSTHDGVTDFVDQVIPVLQRRGLFHEDYEGKTLRDHLGVPYEYGRDSRLTS